MPKSQPRCRRRRRHRVIHRPIQSPTHLHRCAAPLMITRRLLLENGEEEEARTTREGQLSRCICLCPRHGQPARQPPRRRRQQQPSEGHPTLPHPTTPRHATPSDGCAPAVGSEWLQIRMRAGVCRGGAARRPSMAHARHLKGMKVDSPHLTSRSRRRRPPHAPTAALDGHGSGSMLTWPSGGVSKGRG